MRLRPLLFVFLAIPACQSLLGADDFRFDAAPVEPSAGGGGAGGTPLPAPECELPSDCPGTETTCAFRTCDEGRCGLAEAAAGTACTEDEGQLCNGDGACVPCLDDLDCGDVALACVKQECVSASCSDGELGMGEVDVDCGGDSICNCARSPRCMEACDFSSQNQEWVRARTDFAMSAIEPANGRPKIVSMACAVRAMRGMGVRLWIQARE